MTTQDDIERYRGNKVAEMLHLVQDPLFLKPEREDVIGLDDLLANNLIGEISTWESLVGTNEQEMASIIEAKVYEQIGTVLGRKRKHETSKEPEPPAKIIKATETPTIATSDLPGSINSSVLTDPKDTPLNKVEVMKTKENTSQDNVPSLSSEAIADRTKSLTKETEEYAKLLGNSLQNLDVVIAPEHYPTKPHNASSLPELYYLTQTLPLIKLLPSSNKALMTENFELAFLEGKIAVLYSRIEELKRQGKWSFRQPIKYKDPFPKSAHWNSVNAEGKWMSDDFKEGMKFKRACCLMIAQSVQDYWTFGKELTCITTRAPNHLTDQDIENRTERKVDQMEKTEQMKVDKEDQMDVDGAIDIAESEKLSIPDQEEPISEDLALIEEEKQETETKQMAVSQETIDVSDLVLTDSKRMETTDAIDAVVTGHSKPNVRQTSPFKLFVNENELQKLDQQLILIIPKYKSFEEETYGKKPLKPSDDTPITSVSRML